MPYATFLNLLGKLTSVSAVVPLGLLSLRPLQRWLNSFHLDAKQHRHRRIKVSQQCLLTLAPWRDRAYMLKGIPRGSIPSRRETVTTDSCPPGMGCSVAEQDGLQAVIRGRPLQTYQCAGAVSGASSAQALPTTLERVTCAHSVRQHLGCIPH